MSKLFMKLLSVVVFTTLFIFVKAYVSPEVSHARWILDGPYKSTVPMAPVTYYNDDWERYWVTGNISSYNIIGVELNFEDAGADWDAHVEMTGSGGITYTGEGVIWNNCNGSPNSRECAGKEPCFDVCTGGSNQRHQYIVNGWQDGDVDVSYATFYFYDDLKPVPPGETETRIRFVSVTWIYVIRRYVVDGPPTLTATSMSGDCNGWIYGDYRTIEFVIRYTETGTKPEDNIKEFGVEVAGNRMVYGFNPGTYDYTWYHAGCDFNHFQTGGEAQNGVRIDGCRCAGSCDKETMIVWWTVTFYDNTQEGSLIPIRAYARNRDYASEWELMTTLRADFTPPTATIEVDDPERIAWLVSDEVSGIHYGGIRVVTETASGTVTPIPYKEVEGFPHEESKDDIPPGTSIPWVRVRDNACNQTIEQNVFVIDDPGGNGGPVLPGWLMTAFGDTYADLGYNQMEMKDITADLGIYTGQGYFSSYILSLRGGDTTLNRQSINGFVMNDYNDKNAERIGGLGENSIYERLYSLYDSNKVQCQANPDIQVIEGSIADSCVGKKIYFLENDIQLGPNWGQSADPNNACIIISKGQVMIPETVQGVDGFIISDGEMSTNTKGPGSGGSGDDRPGTKIQNDAGRFSSLAFGNDGNPVAAYAAAGPKIVRCNNSSCTDHETPVFLSLQTPYCMAVGVTPDDRPIITYKDEYDEKRLRVLKCNDAACSDNTQTYSTANGCGKKVLTSTSDSNPFIVYSEKTPQGYNYARIMKCGNQSCSSGNIVSVRLAKISYGSLDAIIGGNGYPTIVYTGDPILSSMNPYSIWLHRCYNEDCSLRSYNRVDSVYTYNVAVAKGKNNRPILVYYNSNFSGDKLRIAVCADPQCSSVSQRIGVPNAVADSRFGAMGSDITIVGSEMIPTIFFINGYETANPGLYAAQCTDAFCASVNEPVLIDERAIGFVNMYFDAETGPDGLPIVSYQETEGDFGPWNYRIVKCLTPDCSSISNDQGGEGGGTDDILLMNGSVIANSIDFQRSLPDNESNPAELFRYDPKYLDIFRDCLGEPYSFKIREYQYISSGN